MKVAEFEDNVRALAVRNANRLARERYSWLPDDVFISTVAPEDAGPFAIEFNSGNYETILDRKDGQSIINDLRDIAADGITEALADEANAKALWGAIIGYAAEGEDYLERINAS